MSPGSAPTPRCGHQGQRPCRRCPDRAADGRPSCCGAMASTHPVSVKTLAHELPPEAWHNITWREGSADWLVSRFARLRVRPAHRDTWRAEPRAEDWLL